MQEIVRSDIERAHNVTGIDITETGGRQHTLQLSELSREIDISQKLEADKLVGALAVSSKEGTFVCFRFAVGCCRIAHDVFVMGVFCVNGNKYEGRSGIGVGTLAQEILHLTGARAKVH